MTFVMRVPQCQQYTQCHALHDKLESFGNYYTARTNGHV